MILKSIWTIQNEEKQLKEEFFRKTDALIFQILTNIPSDSLIHVDEKELKVIYAANDRKSLLMEKRPLATFDDYEWIVDNIPGIISAVEEIEKIQIDVMRLYIDKTKKAIEKVDKIHSALEAAL
ncbi:MAG: hypothetical protein KGZ79_05750 [Dethiobacter sp.]|jgi:hypothetical protein|nr:hypothetical protein [Dethiobacter sp.]